MNYRMIGRLMGVIFELLAAFMLPPLVISLANGETASAVGFAWSIGATLLPGVPLSLVKPRKKTMYAREGFALVGLGWLFASLLGALPFTISGAIPRYIDSVFETVSGFTTTGASILTDVECVPLGLLYWRSFTHWVGGMGVLVFLLAVTPMTGGAGDSVHIMRAESPGPQVGKLAPRTAHSARILYMIYIGMTLLQIALMLPGGMPLFDAVTIAFGTAGTGGFAVRNSSMAEYSPYIQWVVTVFMTLFGVNFGVYYLMLTREFKKAARNEELWLYLLVTVISALIVFINILPRYPGSAGDALRHAAFQTSSILTTTGFATTDFNLWPMLTRMLLLVLMVIGASAGSTGGGVKCARVLIAFKAMRLHMNRLLHPATVKQVMMDGEVVPSRTVHGVYAYICTYIVIAAASMLFIAADAQTLEVTVSSVMACLNNIGPGLGAVGPAGNYAALSDVSKLVLSVDMLIGRLEIFPILILCVPTVWKRARS